jgi:rubrerythrin
MPTMKSFDELSEREVLALAIGQEEEDGRIYADFADGLRPTSAAAADALERMRQEESGHRHRLLDLYKQRFGDHIPLIRKQDVKGFIQRPAVWLKRPLTVIDVRNETAAMEAQTRLFYLKAAGRATDAGTRQLLGDLADEERKHVAMAEEMAQAPDESGIHADEEEAKRRLFVLQVVQPGLAGLMDGSVSTLAPLFAAAFATRHNPNGTWQTFLVGLAASLGAGISMGFAEALSDDGKLTGRGHPWIRGFVCGIMTTAGGIGHTLPFLIHNFTVAMSVAIIVVAIELAIISWIRHRYMDTPILAAAFQVVVGGVLVFLTGILIGSS